MWFLAHLHAAPSSTVVEFFTVPGFYLTCTSRLAALGLWLQSTERRRGPRPSEELIAFAACRCSAAEYSAGCHSKFNYFSAARSLIYWPSNRQAEYKKKNSGTTEHPHATYHHTPQKKIQKILRSSQLSAPGSWQGSRLLIFFIRR